jgi:hypothetical protein
LLAETAVAIAIVTPLRDDHNFVVRTIAILLHFGLLKCQFDLEIEHKIIVLTKHSTFSNLRCHFLQVCGYIQHGPLDIPSSIVLSKC